MTITTTIRNESLQGLVSLLRDQQVRKIDSVVPATKIYSEEGRIIVSGAEVTLDADGVTTTDGVYSVTSTALEGFSSKLNIPLAYLRRMHADRPDLFDANINGWLHGGSDGTPDSRLFMLRAFRGDDGVGMLRAVLSDSYKVLDHLDGLTACFKGVEAAGVAVEVLGTDVTDRRMVVRVRAPGISALATSLLDGYRSPFTGQGGLPEVQAGFVFSNSETGFGAWNITPRLYIPVCTNGMVIAKDASRAVHLGARLEEGTVRWSEETQERTLDLVVSKTTDAVRTFLDIDYMTKVIASMEAKAGKPVESVGEVKRVTKSLGFTEEEQDGVLGMFIKGGQMTAGGVMQAVTAYVQTVDDADRVFDLEAVAVRVLETV